MKLLPNKYINQKQYRIMLKKKTVRNNNNLKTIYIFKYKCILCIYYFGIKTIYGHELKPCALNEISCD